ncbi:MAG: hypothetical protein SGJ05_02445 [bacterium]|nr:hypothetical protein [bacterium]
MTPFYSTLHMLGFTSRGVSTRIAIVCALLLSLTLIPNISAQKFKVLAVRGNVTNGSSKLSVGSKLNTNDKITVGKGAYVSMAHINGRTVELKKDGTFKISDLDKAASKKSGSVSGKFASYVYNELTEVKEPIAFSDTRKANMRTTGSVERAAGNEVNIWDSIAAHVGGPGEMQALAFISNEFVASGEQFVVIMPRSTRLLSDTVVFVWHRSPKVNKYRVVITDREEKVVFNKETSDTMMIVNLKEAGVADGQLHYWHAEDAANASYASEAFGLFRLTGQERASAESMIREVKSDFDEEDGAISHLVLASVYEDQGLVYDAYGCYTKAVDAAPGIQNYKRLYAEFLRRQSMNMEAYAAYNK